MKKYALITQNWSHYDSDISQTNSTSHRLCNDYAQPVSLGLRYYLDKLRQSEQKNALFLKVNTIMYIYRKGGGHQAEAVDSPKVEINYLRMCRLENLLSTNSKGILGGVKLLCSNLEVINGSNLVYKGVGPSVNFENLHFYTVFCHKKLCGNFFWPIYPLPAS